jgi:hypothetical protein
MATRTVPVTVVGGYLGAGKTTLVNHLLRHAEGRRLVVMVNDFGDTPIDAALIAARDGDTLALSNGCICCSMGGDLVAAFDTAIRLAQRADALVIEASGVAEPDRIADFRPISGLQPGEQVVGLDFRPSSGKLYALGSAGQLYVIDTATAIAEPVGPGRLRTLALRRRLPRRDGDARRGLRRREQHER